MNPVLVPGGNLGQTSLECHKINIVRMPDPNPLLHIQFEIPFDRIRAEHVEPGIAELLRQVRQQLERLTSTQGERTYANTMEPLDTLTDTLDYAMGVVR